MSRRLKTIANEYYSHSKLLDVLDSGYHCNGTGRSLRSPCLPSFKPRLSDQSLTLGNSHWLLLHYNDRYPPQAAFHALWLNRNCFKPYFIKRAWESPKFFICFKQVLLYLRLMRGNQGTMGGASHWFNWELFWVNFQKNGVCEKAIR